MKLGAWRTCFWATLMASDIKSLFFLLMALFDTTSRALGDGLNCGRLSRIMGISPPPGSLPAALIAWSPGQGGLWLGRSIIIGWRDHCETACHRLFSGRMGTALHLIWPSLIKETGMNEQKIVASCFICPFTGGLGASSGVAFPFGVRQQTYSGHRIFNFQRTLKGKKKDPLTSIRKKWGDWADFFYFSISSFSLPKIRCFRSLMVFCGIPVSAASSRSLFFL